MSKGKIEIGGFSFDSEGEAVLYMHLDEKGLGGLRVSTQYQFDLERKWRFDFAFPGEMLAVEVSGGTWQAGRHSRGDGYEKDCRKENRAIELGWSVLRFTTDMVNSLEAIDQIERILKRR